MIQSYSQEDKKKFDALFKNKDIRWEVEKKYIHKTIKYIKYIQWIPGIRMVGIWNSIAMNSATVESDIDLVIVSDEKRMWLVRIFCTFIFQILNVRKTDKHHAWRFCLSFFCTFKWLDFSKFCLERDPYLYFWVLTFIPLLDKNNCYSQFIEKNSSWADLSLYKEILSIKEKKIPIKLKKNKRTKWFLTSILNGTDNLLKRIFLPKTLHHYNNIWKPYGIIIHDDMLKFHNWDIRKEVSEKL